ncbi:PAS domain S-box-containing protein [Proteiniborus ethanoligenes]|uniref:PAS domain S-box-containing protein n=1 Tax=Proteiniborus ethanoligenes TaxID=415015 RepID=A0A1H3Q8Y9_9FIRM|nr:sigma-54-dependent Fis family transcriptional regulator [Proteiniborus ethanoligenes]SDZ09847.1 PAS domain S-box-containing protein [Proteiniborus ethanoligenes]
MRKDLEVVLNSTYDAMLAIDKDGIITIFNKAAEKLTGIKSEDALNKFVVDVVPDTRLMHVIRTGEPELNKQQKLGDIMIITSRMPIKEENGQIIGAVAIFRDITDFLDLAAQITNLKEIQSMLEAIFHATQEAISVVDQNGINLMINPAYTKVTGLRESDIIGRPASADIAEGESVHMKVLSTKKPVEKARLKVGPNKRDIIANAAPIIVDGELRGSVAILDDVSEIIKLTKELKEAKQIIRKLEAKYTFDDIVGYNKLIIAAIEKAKIAADTPATVILRGESGTGKELFAHAIHNLSKRKFNQFVRVNCAALSENLLESELFGYEEGAFTGARKGGKIGLFEQASGGTIFLDEIGDISLSTQIKLLRVLQEKEVVRVGGTKPISIDVRIIAATNMNLEEAIKDGRFREDLYYRINVIPIVIPALRQRKDDINILVHHFINIFNQEYGRSILDISDSAIEALKGYDWPGNVRELENIIGRSIINMTHNENIIQVAHLPKLNSRYEGDNHELDSYIKSNKQYRDITLEEASIEAEKRAIISALNKYNNNKTQAAKVLNISIRTLYYKIEKYNIQA